MDVTTYQTYVGYLPATRSGPMPAHWSVTHLCNRCFHYVTTQQLITHAQMHETGQSGGEDFRSREHSGTMATK